MASHIFVVVPVSLVFFLPFLVERKSGLGFIANMLVGLALLAAAVWLLRRLIP